MNLGPCDMWQDDSFFFWPNDDSRGTRAATERDAEHLQPLRRLLSPKQPSSLDSQSENQVRLSNSQNLEKLFSLQESCSLKHFRPKVGIQDSLRALARLLPGALHCCL